MERGQQCDPVSNPAPLCAALRWNWWNTCSFFLFTHISESAAAKTKRAASLSVTVSWLPTVGGCLSALVSG